jgi:ribokinase
MTGRVVVVGSLNLDLVVSLDRMPDSGETVFGTAFEQHAGGKGLNQAVAAARLGIPVGMIGALGDDTAGEFLRSVMVDEGIDHAGVAAMPGTSGTAIIEVDTTGANRIVVISGANEKVTGEQVTAALGALGDVAVVLTQGEVPDDAVVAAMEAGRALGAITILNPAPARDYPSSIYEHCDYVIPNEHEAALITGLPTHTTADATAAARAIVRLGAGCVIVTRGSKGTSWATRSTTGTSGVFAVRAIDTVAAGDAFCGGLAAALAQGRTMTDALRFASATGALATTVAGAVPSLPRRSDVDALLASRD